MLPVVIFLTFGITLKMLTCPSFVLLSCILLFLPADHRTFCPFCLCFSLRIYVSPSGLSRLCLINNSDLHLISLPCLPCHKCD